jgi:hypothetical protein
MTSMLRTIGLSILLVFLLPLASHALWWQLGDRAATWSAADWSSAGLLPRARDDREAAVYVMAGRTGRWKGIFAHHTWIVVKPAGGNYTRYDVVGWGRALRTDAYAPDGRWYGNVPDIVLTIRGSEAEAMIPEIRRAVAAYPHGDRGAYVVWPGPNSNTFVAAVAREVPALARALLPTAIGKDFAGWPFYLGAAPSRTGVQVSLGGLLGATIGWIEGVEVNLLGLIAGVDVRRPALKVPGWGRIGLAAS